MLYLFPPGYIIDEFVLILTAFAHVPFKAFFWSSCISWPLTLFFFASTQNLTWTRGSVISHWPLLFYFSSCVFFRSLSLSPSSGFLVALPYESSKSHSGDGYHWKPRGREDSHGSPVEQIGQSVFTGDYTYRSEWYLNVENKNTFAQFCSDCLILFVPLFNPPPKNCWLHLKGEWYECQIFVPTELEVTWVIVWFQVLLVYAVKTKSLLPFPSYPETVHLFKDFSFKIRIFLTRSRDWHWITLIWMKDKTNSVQIVCSGYTRFAERLICKTRNMRKVAEEDFFKKIGWWRDFFFFAILFIVIKSLQHP